MAIYALKKESPKGATLIRDGEERFFSSQLTPDFYARGNTIVLAIGKYEYRINAADSISIDTGFGASLFSGSITELKQAVKDIFFNANAGSGGSGVTSYNDLDDKPFTSAQVAAIKQLLGVDNPDNT